MKKNEYTIVNLYSRNLSLTKIIIVKFFIILSVIYAFGELPYSHFKFLYFLIEVYIIIAIVTSNVLWINNIKRWKYRYFDRKTARLIKQKIRYFLKTNKLYTQENISDDNQETSSKKIITNCMNIGYLVDDGNNSIHIRAYKDGDNFSNKANSFDVELCALFGLSLDNKIDTVNYCEYIFKTVKDERIVVSSSNANIVYNNSTNIPLSTNLIWNIQRQPHLLLAGVTGGGKTTFLNYLILEYKKMEADIYICDPKRSDLASLKNIIGSEYVASEVNQIAKLTRIVKECMEQRFIDYKENANNFVYGHNFVDYKLNPIVLFFDELGAFRAGADKKVLAETMANLSEIILKGREMGVFAILSTQQPNAQNIPTELRDNLSVRVALGTMSTDAYRMVFGENVKDLQPTSEVGTGYIFLDGLGWTKPKAFSAPYLDYKNFNFIEELKKYYN